jgi:hypothetical protein
MATEPTSIAGAAAVASYAIEYDAAGTKLIDFVISGGEREEGSRRILRNLASALSKMSV